MQHWTFKFELQVLHNVGVALVIVGILFVRLKQYLIVRFGALRDLLSRVRLVGSVCHWSLARRREMQRAATSPSDVQSFASAMNGYR